MRKEDLGRREFLQAAAGAGAVVAGLGLPRAAMAVNAGDTAVKTQAVATLNTGASIRLLQFTDVHFFCSRMLPNRDKRTIREFPALIDIAKPDAVLVTGDLWHDNPDGRGQEFMEFAVSELEKLGVPWLFTWGNHDQLDDVPKAHARFTTAKNSLYRGAETDGNYLVELTDTSGAAHFRLACLNSNNKGLGTPEHGWLQGVKPRIGAVPSMVVAHIPVKQYSEIWNNKEASGVRLEEVCSEAEDGSSLAVLKDCVNARSMICGHDHVNDYSGVIDGVELIYGHATGWGGYGGDEIPKGAKLYTLDIGGDGVEFAWETIFADGTRWKPERGYMADKILDTPWDVPAKKAEKAKEQQTG